jgi:hypothetical protein
MRNRFYLTPISDSLSPVTRGGKARAMKRVRQFAVVTAMAAMLAVCAGAQESRVYRDGNAWAEDITGTLPASSGLKVVTALGNVTIQGGDGQDITYRVKKRVFSGSEDSARQQLGELRIVARPGNPAVIQGIGGAHFHHMSAEFFVQVPRGMDQASANTQGGNIGVTGINGQVMLTSGGGNLHVDDVGGSVKASSGGGNVDVGSVRSDVVVRTGGGNIQIGSAGGRIDTSSGGGNIQIGNSAQAITVSTGGGDINVKKCGADLKASTGGGGLEVGSVAGTSWMTTGGGSIRLANAVGPVTAKSGGGTVELYKLLGGAPRVMTGGGTIIAEFFPGNFTTSTLETPAGDIVVYLSPELRATVRAVIDVANGHTITRAPEFTNSIVVRSEGGEYGPRTVYAEGNLNGGGPVLTVHTTTGDIEFRRAKK